MIWPVIGVSNRVRLSLMWELFAFSAPASPGRRQSFVASSHRTRPASTRRVWVSDTGHLLTPGIRLGRLGTSQSHACLTSGQTSRMHASTDQGFGLGPGKTSPDAWRCAVRAECRAGRFVDRFHACNKPPMASRLNILTCLQQAQRLAEFSFRCPQPQPRGRLLLPAPSSQPAPQRGLRVTINIPNGQDTPNPVRIVHVSGAGRSPQAAGRALT